MKRLWTLMLLGGVVLWPLGADAHCDAVDGPVATAALKALETRNVNLVLPYAPAEAEVELTAAFGQALVVRTKGPEAQALADRYFMETAVRLHRAGEHAPYTGLQPAGTDFGPAIPAAEKALASGALEPVLTLISREVARGITERFEQTTATKGVTKEPLSAAGVPLARERVRAELEFIGYVERLHLATKGGGHAE
jgi:hypothetical protein